MLVLLNKKQMCDNLMTVEENVLDDLELYYNDESDKL